jgi:hypothetical protein
MNKQYHISHPQDFTDAINDLRGLRLPYILMAQSVTPEKCHIYEYGKKKRQMAYYYRSVVPTYAKCCGITEEHARSELQIKFARCEEVIKTEDGEWDIIFISEDKLRVIEEGKVYRVQSIADMSNTELSDLINKSKDYILMQYGTHVPDRILNFKTKEI